MSYPDPRYLRTGGRGQREISQLTPGTRRRLHQRHQHPLLAGEETIGGEYGLYKVDMAPKAMGTKEHFHRAISESFYVMSGEVTFYNGERWIKGGEGDFLRPRRWPARLPERLRRATVHAGTTPDRAS